MARVYRALGLLPIAATLMTAVALWIHRESELLPNAYTALEPLRTMRSVLELPGFMVAVLVAFLVGRLRRRGEWRLDVIQSAFERKVSVAEVLPGLVRRVLLTLLVLTVDIWVLGGQTVWDFLALSALVFVGSERRRAPEEWLVLVAHGVIASLVFLAICYSYTVLKALTFVRHVQVDAQIIALERGIFGVIPHRVVAAWASRHPQWLLSLDWVYFRFFHHMALTTVLLVALRLPKERTEYLGALAFCYIIGGPLYHLWPGVGPGYFDPKSFEFLGSHPLLANQIRAWLHHNTDSLLSGNARILKTWGYIACLPSLHVAQEFVMLYYARHSRVALAAAGVFTALTLVSVVALGWHYPLDSLAGAFLAALAIAIARWQRDALMPALCSGERDVELPARRSLLQSALALRRGAARASSVTS